MPAKVVTATQRLEKTFGNQVAELISCDAETNTDESKHWVNGKKPLPKSNIA